MAFWETPTPETALRLAIVDQIIHTTTKVIDDVNKESARNVDHIVLKSDREDPLKEEYRCKYAQRKEAIELVFGHERLRKDKRTQKFLKFWKRESKYLEQSYTSTQARSDVKMSAKGARDDGTWFLDSKQMKQDRFSRLMYIESQRQQKYEERDSFMRQLFERFLWEEMDRRVMSLRKLITPEEHFGIHDGSIVSSRQQEIWVETRDIPGIPVYYTVRRGRAFFNNAAGLPTAWDNTRETRPYDWDLNSPTFTAPFVDWVKESEPILPQELAVLSTLLLNDKEGRDGEEVLAIGSDKWQILYKREIDWIEVVRLSSNTLLDPSLNPTEQEIYNTRTETEQFESCQSFNDSVKDTTSSSYASIVSRPTPQNQPPPLNLTQPSAISDASNGQAFIQMSRFEGKVVLSGRGGIYVPPHRREEMK